MTLFRRALVLFVTMALAVTDTAEAQKVAAGNMHSVAIKSDGTVWAWGDNTFGQLGLGYVTPSSSLPNIPGGAAATPSKVLNITGATKVVSSYYQSMALTSGGSVWAWGWNGNGNLGDGTSVNRPTPFQVPSLSGATSIALGDFHAAASTGSGALWIWGYNGYGQLGDGTTTAKSSPFQLLSSGVASVAAGANHTVILRTDGTVAAWGNNSAGQLGDGTRTNRNVPVTVGGLGGVTAVAAGDQFSLALKSDGSVWIWGAKVGDPVYSEALTPVQITTLSNITALAAGNQHAMARKNDGTLWIWGTNYYGQLGNGTVVQNVPQQVSLTVSIDDMAAGQNHSLGLDSSGNIWSWGLNDRNQLGDVSDRTRFLPEQIPGEGQVKSIASGWSHNLLVKNDGSIKTTGLNEIGQLGRGDLLGRDLFSPISGTSGFEEASANNFTSLARKADGTIWAWGNNYYGNLGDNTTTQRLAPVQTSSISGAISVSAGYHHTMALKGDGTVWTWGGNYSGQLGNGTSTQRLVPGQLATLSGITAIAAGSEHSLALKSDGTVWAWGANGDGAVGDGSFINRLSPVQVSGLTNVIAIDAGSFYSLALKADGTAWAWGIGANGTLGNGSTVRQNLPVRVGGTSFSNVAWIAAGRSHAFARKADGTVWAWGYNGGGQLGDGTRSDRTLPVQISGANWCTSISVGSTSTLALKADGTLLGWGFGLDGELSEGFSRIQPSPAPVFGFNLATPTPVVTITSPSAGTLVPVGTTAEISVSVTPGSGTVSKVFYFSRGGLLGESNSSPFSLSYTPTTWGRFEINAIALNSAGVYSKPASIWISVTSDDVDDDGLSDAWETRHFGGIGVHGALGDPDGDGLTNLQEFQAGSDPNSPDADNDGLSDTWELLHFGNLSQNGFQNPDHDGYNNFEEVSMGTDPKVANSAFVDTDLDGMPDSYEAAHGLASNVDDSLEDADGDRIPNIFEYRNGKSASDPSAWPRMDYIIDKSLGDGSSNDNIFSRIQEGINTAIYPVWDDVLNQPGIPRPYRIIQVKAGIYRENLYMANIPVLLIGETGASGNVVISGKEEGAAVHLETASVLDGVIITHDPGVAGVGVEIFHYDDPFDPQPATFNRRRLVNCVIKGNSGSDCGGIYSEGGNVAVAYCSVTGNSSEGSAYGIVKRGGSLRLSSSIIWGNSAAPGSSGGSQISLEDGALLNTSAAAPNIIGDPNTSAAPGWLDSLDPSLTPAGWLKSNSPARNAGGVFSGNKVLYDIHGELRSQDAATDIGADEFRDADNDGLPDWAEMVEDNDGLSALDEYQIYGTDPRLVDTDGDGMSDGDEISNGLNPLVVEDVDLDGMADAWEFMNGLNRTTDDSLGDLDGDRIPNIFEFNHGTDPNLLQSAPPFTAEVNPVTGDDDAGDNVFVEIGDALSETANGALGSYPIIFVKGGSYHEKVVLPDVPILLLGELGGPAGPAKIISNQSNAALTIESASVVDGFVISHQSQSGSGVYVSASYWDDSNKNRRLVNCIIRANQAGSPAGISVNTCNLDLVHCTVSGNTASYDPSAISLNQSNLKLFNSVIHGNLPVASQQISIGWGSSVTTTSAAPSFIGDANTGSQPGWLSGNPGLLASGYIAGMSSGATNAGGIISGTKVLYDIEGQSRPFGSSPDAGADEYVELTDTDGDGIPDFWETLNGFSPTDPGDALDDPDGDRIPNLWEYQRHTLPLDAGSRPSADWLVDPATAGTGNRVATIGEAIANCPATGEEQSPYSIVEVRGGVYRENLLLPGSKKIVLLGERGLPITEVISATEDGETLAIEGAAAVDGFRFGRAKLPPNAVWSNSRGISVSVSEGEQVSLSNVIVNGHLADEGAGISLSSGWLHLSHSTVYDTTALEGGQAISLAGDARIDIVNSIIWANATPGSPQILVPSTATAAVTGSIIRGGELGAGSADPLLTPRGWLRKNSPAIDSGVAGDLSSDIHGEARISDPDAGADEFADSDNDGLPDWLEANGVTAANGDDDGDGASNLEEYEIQGTNPSASDSDADGMDDAYELANDLDPLADDGYEDADGDRVPNIFEYHHETEANDSAVFPAPTFVVESETGDDEVDDNIFPTIATALAAAAAPDEDSDGQPDPYPVILVHDGTYEENVVLSGVPILMLGELGGASGPVKISPETDGPALRMESPSVVDGFILTHSQNSIGRGVEAYAIPNEPNPKRKFVNCIVIGNTAENESGISAADSDLFLIHCTIFGNSAEYGAPGVGLNGSRLHLFNSVVAKNRVPHGVTSKQIETGLGSSVIASISAPSLVGDEPPFPIPGWLWADPHLATDGRADAYSRVVDRGGSMASTKVIFDIQGQARPHGGAVDIGADEFVRAYPIENSGGNGVNPHVIDTDRDGIPDQWEIANGLNPAVPNSPSDLQTYLNSRDASGQLEVHTPLQ